MKTILLQQVKIYDKNSPFHLQRKNIFIDNGVITRISDDIQQATIEIDASNLSLSVGFFDMRSVLMEPGFEHKDTIESLCNSASAGGFTDIAVLPNTSPVIQNKAMLNYIKVNSAFYPTQVHPIAAATVDTKGVEMTEMLDLHHHGAIAFSDGIKPLENIRVLQRTLLYLQPFEGLLMNVPDQQEISMHGHMHEGVASTMIGMKAIPATAEEIAIQRDLAVLEYTGGKIHFSNISTTKSVELIRQAKKKGLKVTCDVTSYHLSYTDHDLLDFDTHLKVMPPLREQTDVDALWKGLADDTIDVIVSGHYPQDKESKELEFDLADFGMLNLETSFSLIISNLPEFISLEKILDKISHSPRKVLQLEAPSIQENQKACVTLFSESLDWSFKESDIHSLSKNSPLIGKTLKGKPLGIINHTQFQFHSDIIS